MEGFEVKLEEWAYQTDGSHGSEFISYLVSTPGVHTLSVGGSAIQIEAGVHSTATATTTNSQFDTVTFTSAFSTTPVVFASLGSTNDPDPAFARVGNIRTNSFAAAITEADADDYVRSANDDIHWIAIEAVAGTVDGSSTTLQVLVTDVAVTDSGYEQVVDLSGEDLTRLIVGSKMQTKTGGDSAVARYDQTSLTATGVTLYSQEEQSLDNETTHTTESVGLLLVGGQ
ncbi:hypothetical protein [Halioxenophilus sp. WMMB6]|uniref:hypothetical protein n=1 Tax=Halioxenophilus sp. WMMB6 TaxID=3073815 RepID=UPI00295E7AC6|nr:hypothetical protein [Halioxenophilus sp. WMMB6]